MPSLPNAWLRATCSASLTLLAACGGGEEAAPAATTADAPSAAATAVSADCGIAAFASSALARINQIRAAGASCGARGNFAPAGTVHWSEPLAQAAAGHALDMATLNYFSHTSADGRSMADRIDATGFAWSTLGENIAAGQVGIDAVLDGWMRSDGHCANVMNPAFDRIGLACAPGTSGSTYRTYWTLNLARAR